MSRSSRSGRSGGSDRLRTHRHGSVRHTAVAGDSPAMLFRFWYMAWCGELGLLAGFWGSWLAVVLMNSMADWRTRNCSATAISREEKRQGRGQSVINMHLVGSLFFSI